MRRMDSPKAERARGLSELDAGCCDRGPGAGCAHEQGRPSQEPGAGVHSLLGEAAPAVCAGRWWATEMCFPGMLQ